MDETGINNTDFQEQQRMSDTNIEQDRDNLSRNDVTRNDVDREPAKVSLRIGEGDTGDMWRNDSYQEKLIPEIEAVVEALGEIGGGNALLPIEERVNEGDTRAEATRDVVKDYIDKLGNSTIEADKIADIMVDCLSERGISLEEIAEGGPDKLKEIINEIAASEGNSNIDASIEDKLDNLMSALDNLESKIDEIKTSSEEMNKRIDSLSRFDGLTPRNMFKQWAVLSIKMQARADGIPINGHVPKASELVIGAMNFLRGNIFDSLIELAIVKILDKIEAATDKVDNGVESDRKSDEVTVEVDAVDILGSTVEVDRVESQGKIEVNRDGVSDNGTVTKRMDSTDIKNSIECNPAYGSVAGSQLRHSDANVSWTDKNGVTRENTGDTIQYRIMGGVEKGSPVVGKIVVDMETGAKSIIAADRTVVATFGTDKPEHNVGDKVSSSEVDVKLNQNRVENYTEDKYGTRDVTVSVKTAVVENYANAVDTYVDVANKESACLSEQKNEIIENKEFLESKYEAMSDKNKESEFGKEVKDKIDTCQNQIEKIDARIEKIADFTDKAEGFKESYKDFKEGKSDLDNTFNKAISAEDSAVSRSAKFTNDGSKNDWKNGRMFDGVSALDDKDTKEFDKICDFVDNYSDVEAFEQIDTDEQKEDDSVASDEQDSTSDDTVSDNTEDIEPEAAEDVSSDEENDTDGQESDLQDIVDNTEVQGEDSNDSSSNDNDTSSVDEEVSYDKPDEEQDNEDEVDAKENGSEPQENNDTDENEEVTPDDTAPDDENEPVVEDVTSDDEENEQETVDSEDRAHEEDTEAIDTDQSDDKENTVETDEEREDENVSTDDSDNISSDVETEEARTEDVDIKEDVHISGDNEQEGESNDNIDGEEFQRDDLYDEEIIEGVDGEVMGDEIELTQDDLNALHEANESLPIDFIDNEVSYEDDSSVEKPVEHENYFDNESPVSLKDGLEKVNDDSEHYSFEDFVDLYKDTLSEPDGDERLVEAFCDVVEEKGVEGISPDLTYSLAYYDEDGFCKGIDKLDEALAEKGISDEDRESIIDNAIDSYCNDPIADLSIDNGLIEFDVPMSREKSIDVDGDKFEIHRGDTVHYSIDFENGNIISDVSSDKTGNYYVPVDGHKEDIIPFVCDVLGDIYGKKIGEISKDVAQLVERAYPNDKEYVLDKICDHIGDFIEARNTDPWDIADVENRIADTIKNELDEIANDVSVPEEDLSGFDMYYDEEDNDEVELEEFNTSKDDDDDDLDDID